MKDQTERLGLYRTVGQAYMTWFRGLGSFLRCAFAWAVLSILALCFIVQAGIAVLGHLQRDDIGLIICLVLLLFYALALATAGALVAWHRHLLLGEAPGGGLQLDGHGRVYVGRAAIIATAQWALPVVAIVVLIETFGLAESADLILFPSLFAAFAATRRFGLSFPAAAVGNGEVTLARAWRLTRGRGLQLAIGDLMMAVPALAFFAAFIRVGDGQVDSLDSPLPTIIRLSVIEISVFVYAGLSSTFTSLAYRALVGPPAETVEQSFS